MKNRSYRKITIKTEGLPKLIASIAAGFSIILGLVVMVAWHNHLTAIVQVLPNSPPTRYNTALMFLLSGLGLLIILKGRRSLAIIPSLLILAIAGLTIVQYIFDIDTGIDRLLMDDYITSHLYGSGNILSHKITEPIQQFFLTVKRPFPGRSSPNACLAFIFVGFALSCLSAGSKKTVSPQSLESLPAPSPKKKLVNKIFKKIQFCPIAPILASGVIGMGTVAMFGYLTELGTAYTWRYLTGMSLPTSIGLLVLGIGVLSAYLSRLGDLFQSQWLPFSSGFGVFTGSIFLWQALISWSHNFIGKTKGFASEIEQILIPVANIVLCGGLLLGALVTVVLYAIHRVREQSESLKRINRHLDRANSLLEATLESTADGILVLGSEQEIVLTNSQFHQIWGIPDSIQESMRSGNSEKSLPFVLNQLKDPEAFLAANQIVMSQLERESLDIFELKDGRILKCYARPQWQKNSIVGKVLSYRDITDRKRAEDALKQSEERFHAFMNNSPTVAFMKDESGRYVYVNQTLECLFNVKLEDLRGKTDFDWLPEEIAKTVRENDITVITADKASEYIETVPTPDGTIEHWLTFKFPFQDSFGNRYVGGVAFDLTERKRMEDAIFQEKELAQVTLDSIGDAVITTDATGKVEYLNPVAESLTGWSEEEARGLPLTTVFQIVNETTRQTVENPVEKALKEGCIVGLANHTILMARDDREIAIDDSAAPIRDRNNRVVGAVMVFHDVTQSRDLSRQLSWQARHDPLTGLVNRREFEQHLEKAISSAKSENQAHALCYLDLDRFKIVNDTCGHVAGDELLRQVTTLLQEQIRKTDILGRLGGDEFGVLLRQCPLQKALKIAHTLREKIQEFRFIWQDNSFGIGVSIGLVEITADSESLANILIAADSACYVAKNNGRNRLHVFQSDDREVLQEQGQIRWVTRIRKALEEDRFCLYSQLITAISPNEFQEEHYEILLRLQDETGEIIAPMAFIPAAERYNLMHEVDRWVINMLFRHWSSLQNQNKQRVYAINLSGASINDDRFIDFIHEQFALYPVSPSLICFEITETVAIANLTKASKFIRQLQNLGCRFALDDFGSGMSSFAYLKNLPVNYLKIDGEFIKDIIDDPVDDAMVEAITHIGHVMGLKTIAEFVENNAILERIKVLGVDYAQGYGIGKPSPLPIMANG
jgi:diguanylate cyclase (GGDEF)-like protein/PAS domain S-box-containing protein